MAEIARLPTEQARLRPEAVFDHPQEIVDEILLTRGQKLAALARWRHAIAERVCASAEGYGHPDRSGQANEAELLKAVENAQRELDAGSEP